MAEREFDTLTTQRGSLAKLAEAGNKYVAEGVAMIEKYPEVAHYG